MSRFGTLNNIPVLPVIEINSGANHTISNCIITSASKTALASMVVNGNLSVSGTIRSTENIIDGEGPPEGEVYDIPQAVLADLWLAKFGDGWVGSIHLRTDDFFTVAAQRLRFSHLEKVYSQGESACYYRLRK